MSAMGTHSAGNGTVNGRRLPSVMTAPSLPLAAPVAGPLSPWPRDDDRRAMPGPSPRAAEGPSPARTEPPGRLSWPSWGRPDGGTVIRLASSLAVLAVSAIAAVISYSHIYALALATHEEGTAARLLPLSVDGLILASSLTLLDAARRELDAPVMAYLMLALGVGATIAANVEFGLAWGWKSAVVAAWPAVAFIGAVEVALRMARNSRRVPGARRWRPWSRDREAAMTGPRHDATGPVVTPSPEAPAMTPPPPSPVAPQAPPPPRHAAPRKAPGPPSARPATARQAAATADEKITAAITAAPSLATASIPVTAKAAGVSVKSVERYRSKMRAASDSKVP